MFTNGILGAVDVARPRTVAIVMPMVFDIHVHLFKFAQDGGMHDGELDRLLQRMDDCGVDHSLLLGPVTVNQFPQTDLVRRINDHTLAAVRREPKKVSGLCYLNPELDADFNVAEINRCIADGPLLGVKFWVAQLADNDAGHDPIMRRCAELDCPVLYHAWHKTIGRQPQESTPVEVAHLARRHPNVRIIMAHMMGCGMRGIDDVADCDNVWIDTSGSQPEAGILEYALDIVGAQRIAYGSDFPGRDYATQRGKIEAVDLTDDDKQDIYWRNAKRIIGGRWPC